MNARPKAYHEDFTRFFEQPSREGFRELMKNNIGETRSCDFKAEWPEQSDLARHLLGLANSGGGALVIGVAESDDGSLESVGLGSLKDKADITNEIKGYLPDYLAGRIDLADFSFDASEYPDLVGKRFQVAFVEEDSTHLPFVAARDGKKIREGGIYVRHEGVTAEASYEELQAIINQRLSTGHSTQREIDLKAHLEQLRTLYSFLNRSYLSLSSWLIDSRLFGLQRETNPNYPDEDFEGFVIRMIEQKKRLVSQLLEASWQGNGENREEPSR